jgi:hypothetical protein
VGADGALIQLVTRCSSEEEFIERFARFATATDLVVPAVPHVSVGTDAHFVILLKDRAVMMKGRCEVTEIRPVAGAARPVSALMRMRVREMDAHSAGIHLRLMERHASISRAQALPVPPADASPALAPVGSTPGAPTFPPTPESATAAPEPPEPTETTDISPLPRPETRVPGAAFTLPANPLSELDAADLASFIELSLPEAAAGDAPEIAVGPPARATNRRERARHIARRFGPYLACAIGGLLLGIELSPGANVAVVVGAPDVVPPPQAAAPPPAPADDPMPNAAACVARVTTRPAGVAVFWGEVALGASPIDHATVPCGTATVTFRRDRYAEVQRTITAERGQRAVVSERLARPAAKMLVTSSPPNAVIKVNKHRLGPARKFSGRRFERVRVEASLPGYRPWRKTVYLSEPESTIDVTLVPLAGSKAAPRPPTAGSG